MNKKTYRKKRLANDFAKKHKIRVARAHQNLEAIERIMSALGPLKPLQRNKVFRMLEVWFELN